MRLTNLYIIYSLQFITCIILITSCQRELTAEDVSVSMGELIKDSNNNCTVTVTGRYIKQKTFGDSNYIEAMVHVTAPGLYNITSDTINGYYFHANGMFSNNGTLTVKLVGSGMPVVADTDYFTLRYNQSTCEAGIIITDTTIKEALFTLSGAPNNCMNDTVYGSYVKNIPLDTNAKVKVEVNVLATGIFTITSDTVNGYTFSATGMFLKTGIQQVFLQATGKPLNTETDIFSFKAGTSQCSFTVNVLIPQQVTGNDYFPLTNNSFWVYDDLVNIGDRITETVIDSTNINSNEYKIVKEDIHFGGPYQYYYRKSGNDYFEYAAPNKYTTFFQYKKPVYAEIPFLKENITTGTSWQSPEYIDTTTDGTVIGLKYNYTCLDNNATVTLNGNAFANVYIIKMQPSIKTTSDYSYTTETYTFYYAKGIGLIYLRKTLGTFIQNELQIYQWKVY